MGQDQRDDDGLFFYVPVNVISVISIQWKDDNERLCNAALYSHELIFATGEVRTRDLVVRSMIANHSVTQTLLEPVSSKVSFLVVPDHFLSQ